jgi:hypothetical protein
MDPGSEAGMTKETAGMTKETPVIAFLWPPLRVRPAAITPYRKFWLKCVQPYVVRQLTRRLFK